MCNENVNFISCQILFDKVQCDDMISCQYIGRGVVVRATWVSPIKGAAQEVATMPNKPMNGSRGKWRQAWMKDNKEEQRKIFSWKSSNLVSTIAVCHCFGICIALSKYIATTKKDKYKKETKSECSQLCIQ